MKISGACPAMGLPGTAQTAGPRTGSGINSIHVVIPGLNILIPPIKDGTASFINQCMLSKFRMIIFRCLKQCNKNSGIKLTETSLIGNSVS